ncbi:MULTISPECIES: hypothetical protein [Pseudonocardia]|uniref:Uncharacterized protein n=2 Tax=Pseudonocardia TaxID=1847 RepID=A0A1Y2N3H4_PSEAH|nr:MULTISPECIES: hypothetical protein [Pseudonocardia]OSY42022.1 hypothetical protein BG845_01518 [Pseudonocardia autotrophica]TDN75209.1 hypothetical protein C8E95_4353 [Pseudonocardia autotrophica]BBF99154.1 hypothetical protein Pdca_03640 [Pseudonocardia autotrophica]GEC28593.1 hypothetical protein PSA01_56220 [Pseudonocardia saturnea]
MATVFMSIVASAGVGLAVTSALAAYAQRNWKGSRRGTGAV